jgi:IclR family acetate operon transcriptional repressor
MEKLSKMIQRHRRPKRIGLKKIDQAEPAEQYHSRAICRALDVLECFSDQTPLSLKEICGLIKLPESSLFRILMTLEARGYLKQNSDGSYTLAPKVLFGKLHEQAQKIKGLIHPFLEHLAGQLDETASFAFLFGDKIQVLDAVETFHEIRITNKFGRVIPPHCSSLGKAITAFQERDLIDQILESYGLTRRTQNTVVDRQALLADFEHIRALGYAFDREETVMGGICIGAAVAPAGARVVSSISVSTPTVRMTAEREKAIINAVVDSARQAALVLQVK